MRQQAEEGATLTGALLDLAEAGTAVTVKTNGGRTHHGTVAGVGTDFVAVRTSAQALAFVAFAAIAAVRLRPGPAARPPTGDRPAAVDLSLLEALAGAAPDRPRVLLAPHSGEALVGELRAVGKDVVTMTIEGDAKALCYVPAQSVTEVSFLPG